MKLAQEAIERLAEHLERCELEARDTTKITDDYPDMDWEDAYAIQEAIKRRKLARGARVVGFKAGLTSHAKMRQMGVSTPVLGSSSMTMPCPKEERSTRVRSSIPRSSRRSRL